jgi:hypothetical protein
MLRTRRPGSKADERQVSTREDNGSRGALQGWYHGAKSWHRASIRCHRIRLEYGANDGPIVDPLSGDIPNPLDLLVGPERPAATKPACGKWHSCAKAWHNVVVPYRRAGLKNCANDRPSAPFDICQAGIIADGLTAMLALRPLRVVPLSKFPLVGISLGSRHRHVRLPPRRPHCYSGYVAMLVGTSDRSGYLAMVFPPLGKPATDLIR